MLRVLPGGISICFGARELFFFRQGQKRVVKYSQGSRLGKREYRPDYCLCALSNVDRNHKLLPNREHGIRNWRQQRQLVTSLVHVVGRQASQNSKNKFGEDSCRKIPSEDHGRLQQFIVYLFFLLIASVT